MKYRTGEKPMLGDTVTDDDDVVLKVVEIDGFLGVCDESTYWDEFPEMFSLVRRRGK